MDTKWQFCLPVDITEPSTPCNSLCGGILVQPWTQNGSFFLPVDIIKHLGLYAEEGGPFATLNYGHRTEGCLSVDILTAGQTQPREEKFVIHVKLT